MVYIILIESYLDHFFLFFFIKIEITQLILQIILFFKLYIIIYSKIFTQNKMLGFCDVNRADLIEIFDNCFR